MGLFLVRVAAASDDGASAQAMVTKPEPPKTVARTYNGKAPLPDIQKEINTFFDSLVKGDIAKGFSTYLQGTRLAAREDSVRALVENTEHAVTLYGKIDSYEPIDTYMVGTHLEITTYLTCHQITPMRWRFVYYKNGTAWQLLDLRVDDEVSDIVEQ
jgi:hypothetical protein